MAEPSGSLAIKVQLSKPDLSGATATAAKEPESSMPSGAPSVDEPAPPPTLYEACVGGDVHTVTELCARADGGPVDLEAPDNVRQRCPAACFSRPPPPSGTALHRRARAFCWVFNALRFLFLFCPLSRTLSSAPHPTLSRSVCTQR